MNFEQVVDAIRKRENCSRTEAMSTARQECPDAFSAFQLKGATLSRPIIKVAPVNNAVKLFENIVRMVMRDNPKMTRLYTALSPEEMTEDPVFSFNPNLADVTNQHAATMTNTCEDDYPFELSLADGRKFRLKTQADWSARVICRR